MIKQPLLALDMDDVICDWMTEADNFLDLNKKITDGWKLPANDYQKLTEHTRFYRNLGLMPGAQELIDWARGYSKRNNMFLVFLSAIPHDDTVPFAAYDKSLWAHEHYPDIPVFIGPYSHDKHKHCRRHGPGSILIDDRHDNCMEWINAGGIAHIYTNWDRCKEWIRRELKDTTV